MFARLLDLTRKKHLVEDGVHLVEVEDQIQLADIAEKSIEDLDEEVDGLEEGQLVVIGVNARAEEEAGVPAVDDLVVAELDEVGLVFLVARGYEPMDLVVGGSESADGHTLVLFEQRAPTSPLSLIFSSSLYGTYHLASRVLPLY